MAAADICTENINIHAAPEQMRKKAESVEAKASVLAECMAVLEHKINATSYYWEGEAGELYRGIYRESKKEMDEVLHRLRSHAKKLCLIAQQMEQNEKEIAKTTENLMDSVIV